MKKLLYGSAALCVLAGSIILFCIVDYYTPNHSDTPIIVLLPQGTGLTGIAENLTQNHVIRFPALFKLALYFSGRASRIHAGEYAFPAHVSPQEAAGILISGKTVIHHFTVPEGMLTAEILALLNNNSLLEGNITLEVKNGDLLPETYNFSRSDKRNDLVRRMRDSMENIVQESWQGRADNLPFTSALQALTLASIVEKETSLPSERPRVAAVYINRLRRGMLLQADPTTAYAVTGGKERLLRPLTANDLATNSPYNTYRSPGLPPAPIANPGKASILAVLHPEISDELYFVATGTGGHNFARTLEEHTENVRKYRQIKNAK